VSSTSIDRSPVPSSTRVVRGLTLALVALLSVGCAGNGALERARVELRSGDPERALATLAEAEVPARNELLLLLDRGLVAHAAGRYRQSTVAFAEADALIERLDRVSVSEQSAALIVNDRVTNYRGESGERLWINTFQMLNYLALNEPEGAAVEARRALVELDDHPETFAADAVTRLLVAMSFEAAGQFDSASVEYRKLAADPAAPSGVVRAAWLNARRTARPDEAAALAKRLDGIALADVEGEFAARDGQLVLVLGSGFVPQKHSGDLFVSIDLRVAFPYYPEGVGAREPRVEVVLDGKRLETATVATRLVDVARASLAERGKRIAVRQGARAVAKYNIAHSVSSQDQLAGELVKFALFVLEQADTRSWETLPATLSLIQVRLPPGEHALDVVVRDGALERRATLSGVEIKAGQRTFRSLRPDVAGQPTDPTDAVMHYIAHPG